MIVKRRKMWKGIGLVMFLSLALSMTPVMSGVVNAGSGADYSGGGKLTFQD